MRAVHQLGDRVVDACQGVGLCVFQLSFQACLEGGEGFFVLAGSGETEVGQLHHGLEVLGRAVALHLFHGVADGCVYRHFLAGQQLGQVYVAEVAQTSS